MPNIIRAGCQKRSGHSFRFVNAHPHRAPLRINKAVIDRCNVLQMPRIAGDIAVGRIRLPAYVERIRIDKAGLIRFGKFDRRFCRCRQIEVIFDNCRIRSVSRIVRRSYFKIPFALGRRIYFDRPLFRNIHNRIGRFGRFVLRPTPRIAGDAGRIGRQFDTEAYARFLRAFPLFE